MLDKIESKTVHKAEEGEIRLLKFGKKGGNELFYVEREGWSKEGVV